MDNLNNIKLKLTELKPLLQKKYPLESIAIFGSYSRNQQTHNSDVDILVEFNNKIGIEFVDMADEIEDYLGIKIDLITKKSIHTKFFDFIKNDLIYV